MAVLVKVLCQHLHAQVQQRALGDGGVDVDKYDH